MLCAVRHTGRLGPAPFGSWRGLSVCAVNSVQPGHRTLRYGKSTPRDFPFVVPSMRATRRIGTALSADDPLGEVVLSILEYDEWIAYRRRRELGRSLAGRHRALLVDKRPFAVLRISPGSMITRTW